MDKIVLVLTLLYLSFNTYGQIDVPSTREYPENKPNSILDVYIDATSQLNAVKKVQSRLFGSNFVSFCGLEYHGNSTLLAEKKSFDLEFRTSEGAEINYRMPGLPFTKDLVFLANFYDPSFIRNSLAFHLWDKMGHISPEYEYYNLYLNNQYQGLYMAVEKIKSLNHLIDTVGSNPIGNGKENAFLMRFDRKNNGIIPVPGLMDNMLYADLIATGIYENSARTLDESLFMENVSISLQNIVKSDSTIIHYSKLIDVKSFVDFFLMNELSKNPDAYRSSVYCYRSANGLLTMGPIWDFDLAFANKLNPEDDSPEGWMYKKELPESELRLLIPWWHQLMCDDAFRKMCVLRIGEIEKLVSSDSFVYSITDELTRIESSFRKDEIKWGYMNDFSSFPGPLFETLEEKFQEIQLFMQNRLNWMKANLMDEPCLPPFSVVVKFEEFIPVDPDTIKKEFKVSFGKITTHSLYRSNSNYQTNNYSSLSFVLLNEKGIIQKEGPAIGSELVISYKDLTPGTYYLIISEESIYQNMAMSAVFLPEKYLRKLTVK